MHEGGRKATLTVESLRTPTCCPKRDLPRPMEQTTKTLRCLRGVSIPLRCAGCAIAAAKRLHPRDLPSMAHLRCDKDVSVN